MLTTRTSRAALAALAAVLAGSLAGSLAACSVATPGAGEPGAATGEASDMNATVAAGATTASGTVTATATSAVPTPDMAAVARAVLGPDARPAEAGAYFEDLEAGTGDAVDKCDLVIVHYVDGLPDGTVIADTHGWGYPFLFTYGAEPPQVIPGWVNAVAGMKAGGHRRVLIPPDQAYGQDGVPGLIPPNSPMLFDVDLLEIHPPPPLPAGPAEVTDYEQRSGGIEYAILSEGAGAMAKGKEWAHIHYTGWLEDGTMFDTTLDDDPCGPYLFPLGVGQAIPGWDGGIVGMRVGERRQLRLPPALAFGAEGNDELKVPPNSTVIYDITLMGTKPMQDPTAIPPATATE